MRSILLRFSGPDRTSARPLSLLFVWAPAAVAVLVIVAESTRTFSAENTSGWLRPIYEAIFGHMSDATWAAVHHVTRKSGHFLGYGLVCLSFVRAWLYRTMGWAVGNPRWWRLRASGFGVTAAAVVAALDEWHQTHLSNRTGRFADVVLDTCGGMAACAVLWGLFWWRDRDVIGP